MTEDRTALADWNTDDVQTDAIEKGLVWWSRLDGRWQVETQRTDTDDYRGVLCIFDHEEENKLVYSEEVGLAYGAQWGPDVADVAMWQNKAVDVVDDQLSKA